MTFRPTVVRESGSLGAAPHEDLARSEKEIDQKEAQLYAEEQRFAQAYEALASRAEAVKTQVQQAQKLGSREPAIGALLQRGQPDVALDLNSVHAQAQTARVEALRARSKAVDEGRGILQAQAAKLSLWAAQLKQDEADAARWVEQAKKAAEAPPPPIVKPAPPPVAAQPPPRLAQPVRPPDIQKTARREAPRVKMQASVDFSSDSNFFTGFSTNISEGGLFIATVQHLELGTPVDLSFSLPSGQKLAVHGVVRWTREVNDQTPDIFPGVGVQFVNAPAEMVEAIREFVAAREPMFYPD